MEKPQNVAGRLPGTCVHLGAPPSWSAYHLREGPGCPNGPVRTPAVSDDHVETGLEAADVREEGADLLFLVERRDDH